MSQNHPSCTWVNPSPRCSLFFPPTPLIVFLAAMKKCAMPQSEPLDDHRPRLKWFGEGDVTGGMGYFHSGTLKSYNSTSAIGRHLLANQPCACVYSPSILTINSWSIIYEKYKPELWIQKQFYTPLLFNKISDHQRKTLLLVPTALVYCIFFSIFFFTSPGFSFAHRPMLTSSSRTSIVTDNSLKRGNRKKGSFFWEFWFVFMVL